MLKSGLLSFLSKCPKQCGRIKVVTHNGSFCSTLSTHKHSFTRTQRAIHNHYDRLSDDLETGDEGEEAWTKAEDVEDKKTGALSNFNLSNTTILKLKELGIEHFFPVQTHTFQLVQQGTDLIVQARTGSGKTMSYAIPLLEKLLQASASNPSSSPKLLVLAPTRELANQVSQVFMSLSPLLRVVPVYGGASATHQERQLQRGADVVVGTPGRLLDLLGRGSLQLGGLEHVVLDEVDRMLDMGFEQDVNRILSHRYHTGKKDSNPQTLLFSATVPAWVRKTAHKYLQASVQMIDLVGPHSNKTATSVKHTAMLCSREQRETAILDLMNQAAAGGEGGGGDGGMARTIVFCQTKREVDELGRRLRGRVVILHGDVSQQSRDVALQRFKAGEVCCLAATDVAARGLDIPDVDLVIQCSPPPDVDAYIHRAGRTGRAGKAGSCVLLYTAEEADDVRRVQAVAKCTLERVVFERSPETTQQELLRSLRRVNRRVREKYDGLKGALVDELGADGLMTAAIAILAGHSQKSLLTNRAGVTTMHVTGSGLENPSQALLLLQSFLPEHLMSSISNLTLCRDLKGAVFDVASHKEDSIMLVCLNTPIKLSIPDKLPPIQPLPSSSDHNFPGHSSNRRPPFDRRNSYSEGGYGDRRNSYSDRSGGGRRNSSDVFGGEKRGGQRGGGRDNFSHARSPYKSLQD